MASRLASKEAFAGYKQAGLYICGLEARAAVLIPDGLSHLRNRHTP